MSYYDFRDYAGIDNSMDRYEYQMYSRRRSPFLNFFTGGLYSNIRFNMADRNRDGRLDYFEFASSHPYSRYSSYPGYY